MNLQLLLGEIKDKKLRDYLDFNPETMLEGYRDKKKSKGMLRRATFFMKKKKDTSSKKKFKLEVNKRHRKTLLSNFNTTFFSELESDSSSAKGKSFISNMSNEGFSTATGRASEGNVRLMESRFSNANRNSMKGSLLNSLQDDSIEVAKDSFRSVLVIPSKNDERGDDKIRSDEVLEKTQNEKNEDIDKSEGVGEEKDEPEVGKIESGELDSNKVEDGEIAEGGDEGAEEGDGENLGEEENEEVIEEEESEEEEIEIDNDPIIENLDFSDPEIYNLYIESVKLDQEFLNEEIQERFFEQVKNFETNQENLLKKISKNPKKNNEFSPEKKISESPKKDKIPEYTLSKTLEKLDRHLSPAIATKSHIHLEDTNQTANDLYQKLKHNFYKYTPLKDSMDSEFELSPVRSNPCEEINDLLIPHFEGKLTCFYFTKKLLVIGTDEGEIVELDRTKSKCRKFSLNGTIVSVDINNSSSVWAAGSSEGHILIKKSCGGWAKKTLNNFGEGRPITQVRFYKNMKMIVSTDCKVTRFVLRDIKLSFDVAKNVILSDMTGIVQIITMPISKGKTLNITGSLDKISFHILTEYEIKFASEVERPDYIKRGWLPTVSWMITKPSKKRAIIVYWKDYVMMIRNDGLDYLVCGHKKLEKNILWGAVLGNKIVSMIDEDYVLRLETFENIFSSDSTDSKKAAIGGSFQLPKDLVDVSRTVCVRDDGNLSRTHQEKIRCLRNGIGFVHGWSLITVSLLDFEELARLYIEKNQFAKSLCLLIQYSNFYADSQIPLTVKNLAPELTIKYLNREKFSIKNDDSKSLNISVLNCIETLIKTDNIQFIFTDLMNYTEPEMFWTSIDTFVQKGLLNNIKWKWLRSGLGYLRTKTLEKLILNLSAPELKGDHDKIMTVLEKDDFLIAFFVFSLIFPGAMLTKFLAKLQKNLEKCDGLKISIFKDFCSKIGYHDIYKESSEKFGLEKKELDTIWILWKLITWSNMKSLGVQSNRFEVLGIVTDWMLEKSNLLILMKTSPQVTIELIISILMNFEFLRTEELTNIVGLKWGNFLMDVKSNEEHGWSLGPKNPEAKKILVMIHEYLKSDFGIDFAFFYIKILKIPAFDSFMGDVEFSYNIFKEIFDYEFEEGRLWDYFEVVIKDTFEKNLIKFLGKFDTVMEEKIFERMNQLEMQPGEKTYQEMKTLKKKRLRELQDISRRKNYVKFHDFCTEIIEGYESSLKIKMRYLSEFDELDVIRWFNEKILILKRERNEELVKKLTQIFSENLEQFIASDSPYITLIMEILTREGCDVINRLSEYPELQIKYLAILLQKEKYDPSKKVKITSKLLYVRLVAQLHPESLSQALETFNFPLDDCLKICEETKNYFGSAYIKFRLGMKQEAIKSYKKIFKRAFDKFLSLRNLENKYHVMAEVGFTHEKLLNLCLHSVKEETEEGKKYFKDFLIFAVEAYEKIGEEEEIRKTAKNLLKVHELRRFIREKIIQDVLSSMFQHMSSEISNVKTNKQTKIRLYKIKNF